MDTWIKPKTIDKLETEVERKIRVALENLNKNDRSKQAA